MNFSNKYMNPNLSCVSYMTVFSYMDQLQKENCTNAGEIMKLFLALKQSQWSNIHCHYNEFSNLAVICCILLHFTATFKKDYIK